MKSQLELYRHVGPAKPADQRVAMSWFARMKEAADQAPDAKLQTHKARAYRAQGVTHLLGA